MERLQASTSASQHHAQKHKKSRVCLFIQIAILFTVLLAVFVGLIFYFGAQQPHTDIPHALNEIFGTQVHKDLIAKLNKKAYQHSILWGANETGIFEFLDHYADTRASLGGLVIVKKVENNFYETALKFIRYTKEYIEQNINLESDMQKVQWVFEVRDAELPLDELQRIKNNRPNDRIVVGVNRKPATTLKGYKKVQFPAVPIEVVQEVIVNDFEVSPKQASILVNFYGTIPEILKNLNQISYTHEKHLGVNFQNLKDLSKSQLKNLKALCEGGVAALEGSIPALEEIGAVTYDGKVYWQERVNRLNYELSQQVQCVDKVVPDDIKIKIAQRREEQSKAEIQSQDEEQPVEAKTVQQKPTPAKKQKKGAEKPAQKTNKIKQTAKKVEKVQKVQKVQKTEKVKKAKKTTEQPPKEQKKVKSAKKAAKVAEQPKKAPEAPKAAKAKKAKK